MSNSQVNFITDKLVLSQIRENNIVMMIIEILEKNGPMTASQIATEIGYSRATTINYLTIAGDWNGSITDHSGRYIGIGKCLITKYIDPKCHGRKGRPKILFNVKKVGGVV